MTNFVLSAYPLSQPFQDRLRNALKAPLHPVTLAGLRRRGVFRMLYELRKLRGDRLYIACEDPSSEVLVPVLNTVAAFTRVRRLFSIDGALEATPISRARAALHCLHLAAATASGIFALVPLMSEARRLLRAPRIFAQARGNHALYLNANLWFGVKAGGSVGHISGVINGLLDRGYHVLFCSSGGRMMVGDSAMFVPLQHPEYFGLPWELNSYRFDSAVVEQVQAAARNFHSSFIYQRMSIGNFSGVRLSRRLGIPLVLEYNGSEVWVARHWGRRLKFERSAQLVEDVCLKHAHLIVTVSSASRDELMQRGVEGERIVSYPNCIDPTLFNPDKYSTEDRLRLRSELGIDRDSIVVGFLGSFGHWHGVPILAHAIHELIKHDEKWLRSRSVRFLLMGDGIKMPEVRQMLEGSDWKPYVIFTGLIPQDRAPLHLAICDVLSSPHIRNPDGSAFFGSPTKLFEYMAMGKAIAASDLDQIGVVLRDSLKSSSLPSQFAPGSSAMAVLCEPGNVHEHMAALRFLVDEAEWRRELGRNARAEVLKKYTWEHHVAAILSRMPLLERPSTGNDANAR